MGPPLADPGEGGRGSEDVTEILNIGCAGNTTVWVRDLGGNPLRVADPGGVPPPGGTANHREYPEDMAGWGMEIPSDSRVAKGGGDQGFGGVHQTEAEHSGLMYLHPAHHGPLPVSGEMPGG